jgi:hypothetical protein
VDTYSLKHASTAYLSSFFRSPQFMTGLSNAMKQEFERANAAKLVTKGWGDLSFTGHHRRDRIASRGERQAVSRARDEGKAASLDIRTAH